MLMPSPNSLRKKCKLHIRTATSLGNLLEWSKSTAVRVVYTLQVYKLVPLPSPPTQPHTHTLTHTHTHTHSTTLRVSRSARPTSLDGGPKSAAPVSVGKKGKDFEFSDLALKVQFVECSARGKGAEGESVADVDDVIKWLNKHC